MAGTWRNFRELGKDSLLYGASSVLSQIASVVLVPFYTQALSPADYGVVAIASVCLGLIGPLATLGMDGALFRFYSLSEDVEKKLQYLSSAFVLKALATFVLVPAVIPCYFTINRMFFEGLLTKFQFGLLLATFAADSFTMLTLAWLRSERRVMRIAVNNLVVLSVSIFLSIYLVLTLKMGVEGALLASLLAALFRLILLMRDMMKTFSFRSVDRGAMRELLSYGLPIIPHKLQGQAIILFTTFIINQQLGLISTGLYAVAQKLAKPLSLVVGTVQQSWTPYKFQIHKVERNAASVFRNLIVLYWIGLLVIWGLLSIATPWVFKLLIDRQYWAGIPYVPFITFVSVAQGFYFTVTTGFELSKNQKRIALGSFAGLVSLVGLSAASISFFPPFSFMVAQAISFFVIAAVLWPEARRMIRIEYPFWGIAGLFVFTVACIVIGFCAESPATKWSVALLLVAGASYYVHLALPGSFDQFVILYRRMRGIKIQPVSGGS
jgi:O-antigen/teichoic acid export membrane protein